MPQANRDWLVDVNQINSAQNNDDVIIVDSRDLRLAEPIDPIVGSIPNAVDSLWKQISHEFGHVLSSSTNSSSYGKILTRQKR